MNKYFLTLSSLFLISIKIFSASFTATQSGNWNIGTTWGGLCAAGCTAGVDFPGTGDDVIIDAFDISVTADATCLTITVNPDNTSLSINSTFLLTVEDFIEIYSAADASAFDFNIDGYLYVENYILMDVGNSGTYNMNINSGGKLNINSATGTSLFKSRKSGGGAIININVNDTFITNGNLTLQGQTHTDDSVNMFVNARTEILGTTGLKLTSTSANADVLLELNDTLVCFGALTLNTSSNQNDVRLDMTNTNNAFLDLQGQLSITNQGGLIDASAATNTFFRFSGSAGQNVKMGSGYEYDNLIIANTSVSGAALTSGVTTSGVLGNITIENNSKLVAGSNDITFGGDLTINGNGTITQTSTNKISFAGSAQQTIYGTFVFPGIAEVDNSSMNGLTLDGSSAVTFNDLNILAARKFNSAGANYIIKEDITNNGGTYTANVGDTTTFSGTSLQTVTGTIPFDHTIIANSSGVNLATGGDAISFNNLTINSGCFLDPDANDFSVRGNWINNNAEAGFTPDAGCRVRFNGSTAQTITGSDTTDFQDISVENTSTGLTATNPIDIIGVLDVQDGAFNGNSVARLVSNSSATAVIADLSDGTPDNPAVTNIIVERYMNEHAGSPGWNFVASPLTNTVLDDWDDDLYTTGNVGSDDPQWFFSIQGWDEAACASTTPDLTTQNTNNGSDQSGWFIYENSGVTIDATGSINQGIVSIAGLTCGVGCAFGDGWHVLGNPYAAHVTWDNVTLTNISGAGGGSAYVLQNDNSGNFIEYDHSTPTDILASGEGFYVQVAAGMVGEVRFDENDKTNSNTPDNFNSVKLVGNIEPVLKINMLADGTRSDFTKIGLRDNAAKGYEWFNETTKMGNANNLLNIATVVDDIKVSRNSIPSDVDSIVIPIVLYRQNNALSTTNQYDLTFNDVDAFLDQNKCMTLIDSTDLSSTIIDTEGQTHSTTMMDDGVARLFLHVSSPLTISSTNPTCFDLPNATARVTGKGNGPFNYTWQNANGNTVRTTTGVFGADSLSNVTEGIYTVIVTNNEGCGTVRAKIELMAPVSPNYTTLTSEDVTCHGGNDGTASAHIFTGNAGRTFLWSNGNSDSLATNLSAGTYTVSITDSTGCSFSKSIMINDAISNITQKSKADITCFGSTNGGILLQMNGDLSNYTFGWSNGVTTHDVYGLSAGTYYVTVSHSNGCVETDSVTIDQPEEINSNAVIQNASCFGLMDGTITLNTTGGVAPYDINLAGYNTSFLDSLTPGSYTLFIMDQNQCQKSLVLNVTEPPLVDAAFSTANDTFYVNEPVIFTNTSAGATQSDWNFGDASTSSITDPIHTYLASGTYSVRLLSSQNGQCADSTDQMLYILDELVSVNANGDKDFIKITRTDNTLIINTSFNKPEFLKIKVYNALGQDLVRSTEETVSISTIKIALPDTKGMYILSIYKNDEIITKQVIR